MSINRILSKTTKRSKKNRNRTKKKGEKNYGLNIQICPGGALQQALLFQLELKSEHDKLHHIQQQPLASGHFHHSPTAGHKGKLGNVCLC